MKAKMAKISWVIGVLLVILGLSYVVHRHLYRVQVWHFTSRPFTAWTEPFGHTTDALALAKGLDGRIYGPLAFVIRQGHPIIADTYQHRIVMNTRPWHIIATGHLLAEDLVDTGRHLYFVDNQTLSVFRVDQGKLVKIIQLHPPAGQTEMIWHMASDGQTLLLEGVKLGKGEYETWLRQYQTNGRLLKTLSVARTRWDSPFEVSADSAIGVVIRSFSVSPKQQLAVEVADDDANQRLVQIYSPQNRLIRQAHLISPEPIIHSQLLGMNKMGWIYWGVNLTDPGKAFVAVLTPRGRTLFIKVHAVKVASGVYGVVSPNGSVYLLQSTAKEYRIVKWTLVASQRWSWNGHVL